ncbi:hypothetical protein GCM10027074_69920 [Streptomyces deserti]
MLSSTPSPDTGSGTDGPETERLLAAAVRIADALPAGAPLWPSCEAGTSETGSGPCFCGHVWPNTASGARN